MARRTVFHSKQKRKPSQAVMFFKSNDASISPPILSCPTPLCRLAPTDLGLISGGALSSDLLPQNCPSPHPAPHTAYLKRQAGMRDACACACAPVPVRILLLTSVQTFSQSQTGSRRKPRDHESRCHLPPLPPSPPAHTQGQKAGGTGPHPGPLGKPAQWASDPPALHVWPALFTEPKGAPQGRIAQGLCWSVMPDGVVH